ncbi:MAG TPA: hypothetical protein VHI98_06175 [Vicinamibacterales bacterium]|jgi:hypothetical protein|nr:hypothetical protein [Vicinamibacterales bacterium]
MARSRSALALAAFVVVVPVAAAQAPPATSSGAPPAKAKYVPPVKGVAEIGILKPDTKVVGNEVVTKIKVKNLSLGAIHLLRVDEYWYDKKGNMLPGATERWRKPFMPGEVIEFQLRVPKNPAFFQNTYKFTHANGQCKAKTLKASDFTTKTGAD